MRTGSSWSFVSPPHTLPPITAGWTKTFIWEVCTHNGDVSQSGKDIIYAPGTNQETKGVIIRPELGPTPPPARIDGPPAWNDTPKGGGKSKGKSFADAARATHIQQTKVTGPQRSYNNIPTACFMQPAPKAIRSNTWGYGKKYMVKFHRDNKIPEGSQIPPQAATSEINRTCASLNIKANTTEWTSAGNLLIYFTYDSVDSQIEKS